MNDRRHPSHLYVPFPVCQVERRLANGTTIHHGLPPSCMSLTKIPVFLFHKKRQEDGICCGKPKVSVENEKYAHDLSVFSLVSLQ
jgi:hypothetical protein